MGHRLFVVRPIRWQPVAILIQGLPEARDVAVTVDREDSAKKRNDFVALRTFNPCTQTRKVAYQGLCSCQPHGPTFGNAKFLWKGYRFIHTGTSKIGWLAPPIGESFFIKSLKLHIWSGGFYFGTHSPFIGRKISYCMLLWVERVHFARVSMTLLATYFNDVA